jgi:hypothetical protein
MTTKTKLQPKKSKIKKGYIIAGSILIFLVVIYFILPIFILSSVNKKLAKMEGYTGHINALHLDLFNFGFSIYGFKIEKVDGDVPKPFIYIEEINNFLEFKSLLHGKFLGTMKVIAPNVNFVKGPTKATTQTGAEGNWVQTLQDLPNFTFNSITIERGKVAYLDMHSKPKVDVFVGEMYLKVTNLQNVVDKDKKLPSHLVLTGNSIGKGDLDVTADLNVLKEVPDFNMDFKFRKVNLPALNDLAKAYADFTFDKGNFSLFVEAAMYDSHVKGYALPIIEKVKVLDWKQDKDETVLQKVWEGFVGVIFHITSNPTKHRFATKIPFEGDLKDIKVGIWSAISNIFKNEFVKVFPKSVDNTVNFSSAEKEDADDKVKANDKKDKEKKY